MTLKVSKTDASPATTFVGDPMCELIVKTRTGKVKTTTRTLLDCDCEMFDSFLQDRWTPRVDKKGRRKLRLDFDDEVFRHTLLRMQNKQPSTPPSFGEARIEEQQRQLKFLCHRPTLAVAAALPEADRSAAAQVSAADQAAKTIRFRSPPVTTLDLRTAVWGEVCDFTLRLESEALSLAKSSELAQAINKVREGADIWRHIAQSQRFEDLNVLRETARKSADRLLLRALNLQKRLTLADNTDKSTCDSCRAETKSILSAERERT